MSMKKSDQITISKNGATITCNRENLAEIMALLNGETIASKSASTTVVRKEYIKNDAQEALFDTITATDPAEFVIKALSLPELAGKSINTVYSGFNKVMKKKFPNTDPKRITTELQTAGLINGHGGRSSNGQGYYVISLPTVKK